MIAWVNTRLLYAWVWMIVHCHSFLCIIGCDILEDFSTSQRISIFRITGQPESGSLCIEIICNRKIIFPCPHDGCWRYLLATFLLLCWLFSFFNRLGELIIVIITVINIKNCFVLRWWVIFHAGYNLHLLITIIINIHYHILLAWTFSLGICGLNPTILNVPLKFITMFLLKFLQILNSFYTRNAFCNKILMSLRKMLGHIFFLSILPPLNRY